MNDSENVGWKSPRAFHRRAGGGRREGFSTLRSGFTLLEMLVVIVVLGIAAAIVAGSLPPRSARAEVRAGGAMLAGGLRAARGQAIATDRPVTVAVDAAARAFRVGAAPIVRLPARLAIAADRPAIVFAPDGSSSGGRVELASGSIRMQVDVSWLTGRVLATEDR
jgi:general secretion pathway protein H